MRTQGKRIFDAPTEDKEKCTIQKNNRGWSGMNYETLDPKNQRVRTYIYISIYAFEAPCA